MRQENRVWRLYVDESGKFEAHVPIVVGGILVNDGLTISPEAVRRHLEAELPWMPWPFHAADYNLEVFAPIAAYTWAREGQFPEPEKLKSVLTTLQREKSSELEDVVHLLRTRQNATRRLAGLNDWLRAARRPLWRSLQTVRSQVNATFQRVLREIGKGSAPMPVTLATAAEGIQGDAASEQLGITTADSRYLGALKCLIARAGDAVLLEEGNHRIDLHVLGRHVTDRQRRSPRPLVSADVKALASRVAHDPRVTIGSVQVHAYDEHADAALVLADFVANRAVRRLAHDSVPLKDVLRLLHDMVPLEARLRPEAPVDLAATGIAQRWVDQARRGVLPEDCPPAKRPAQMMGWAHQQALEWVNFVARMRTV